MDNTDPKIRGEQLGFLRMVGGVGIMIGPMLAVLTSTKIFVTLPLILMGITNFVLMFIIRNLK